MNRPDIARGATVHVAVGPDPIDAAALMTFVADDRAGATVLFSGTVRNHSPGREGVTKLAYEAYDDVVDSKIREVIEEAQQKWPVLRIAAVHRTGVLGVGDAAVMVAVSTAHRADAFPAGRYVIDELKSRAPIWKKEHWDGGAEWVREDLQHADPAT